ncbi:hypothetical protein ACHAPT_001515 [Fusarium lateritium]
MPSSHLLLAILLTARLANSQCYYPDGQEAPRDVPCDPDAEASPCCAPGYMCISTGMCQALEYAGTSRFARGSCSQQDWSSSNCPNFCTEADGELTGGTDVTRCQGYSDRFFCPRTSNAKDVCGDPKKALTFAEPSTISTILPESQATQSSKSTATETTEATTTTSSSEETSSTAKNEESSTASSSPNETEPADKDSSSSPSPALLGGAIGGSIGGFLLGGLGVWLLLWFRKRNKKAAAQSQPEVVEGGYKDERPAPKAEMSGESAPAELPGYSVDDRSRQ